MFLLRSIRFCHFVLYLHLFEIYIASVVCYYDNPEEELVQPNRIDEVSSNFECRNEGYFADVTYGCQFYHVCENTNSPYDKPSFVKHTFSCVNGTVFNQMSFTCTRYQDSIPCEVSPNYFYLNKRNGDPKAYFLTDDDIVKPSANSKHAIVTSNGRPTYTPVANKASVFKLNNVQYAATNSPVASSPRPVTLPAKQPIAEPRERSSNYDRRNYDQIDGDYESNSLLNDNSYTPKTSPAPYEFSPNYSANGIKPGVRYSRSKYEPVKYAEYERPRSKYTSDIRSETSLLPRAEVKSEIDKAQKMSHYRSASSVPSKMIDSNIGQFSVNYEVEGKMPMGNQRSDVDQSKGSHISYSAPPKRTPFTPAAFSKMYMENQKATKYSPASLSAVNSNGVDYGRNTNAESNYPRQKLLDSQPKMYPHYTDRIASKERSLPASRYEVANEIPSGLVKSSQYEVPTSIRIIEPEDTKEEEQQTRAAEPSAPNDPVPVKMAFVKQQQRESPSSADFSNLRVVKSIKGKNLLIDPSLENDPSRDDIIERVLQMLNNYN